MTLVDLINVPHLSDPQISNDGTQVLFVRADADWKANKPISHIWRVNVDGTGVVQLTRGAEGENDPRWSPDGKSIAFVAKRGTEPEAVAQIFMMANEGGEARPVTNHASAVMNLTWSPDGKSIYFRAAEAKSDELKAREKAKDDVFQYDEDYQQVHLWKVAVESKAEHRITEGNYSIIGYTLSEDGMKIAMHRAPTPLLGDAEQGEVWVMQADGTNARLITHNHVGETRAILSPDNSQVLFLAAADRNFNTYYNAKVFVAPAGGGEPRLLMPDLPYEVMDAAWAKDGKSIYFLANMGVHSELFKVPVEGGKPEQLTNGEHTIGPWMHSNAAGKQVYLVSEMTSPGEVWLSAEGSAPVKLTDVYESFAKEFRLPKVERVEWKGADGKTVEGLLYYPLDYKAGQRYPLVVQSHGGPAASDRFGLGGLQNYTPVLTAKGYAALQPNYRGSTGYGDEFLRDMVGHYFENAHLDVMAGVDEMIRRGIADPDRLVKMGWSAGGHMTNKIITYTTRFKAASSGAGAANWISMYAESDIRSYRTPWFGGTPWQKDAPIAAYWDNSPLKDVWKVTTPTIFLVGEKDPRVPEPQSIEMFRALRSNGVPTHLYVAPREPHGWGELRHVLFKMNVELEWFEKYAMDRPYTREKAPGEPEKPKEPTKTTATGQ